MRVPVACLLLVLILAPSATYADDLTVHEHGPVVLVPMTNGTFLVGAFGDRLSGHDLDRSENVTSVTHHSWETNTTDCHRRLFIDLDWRPTSASGDPDAPVDVPYLFEVGITLNETHVRRVSEPGDRIYLGEMSRDGDLTLHLVLRQGAAVDWTFRAYAYEGLTTCATPLEQSG